MMNDIFNDIVCVVGDVMLGNVTHAQGYDLVLDITSEYIGLFQKGKRMSDKEAATIARMLRGVDMNAIAHHYTTSKERKDV